MKFGNRCFAIGLVILTSSLGAAVELESNVDLSASSSAYKFPTQGQWEPYTSLNAKFNAWLYPNNNMEVSVRYGIAASGAQSADVLAQRLSSLDTQADYLVGESRVTLWKNKQETVSIYHQLEQMLLTYWLENASVNVGRQTISLGLAKAFSPADVIAPSSFDDGFSGYRFGVDAVRLTWYAGPTSEVDIGIIKADDQAIFARYKTNTHDVDIDVTAIQLDHYLSLVSFGTMGGLGGFGVWQESALYREQETVFARSTLGADTTIFEDLYLMAEYHFNGLGKQPGAYLERLNSPFYQLGAIQPAGRHYVSVTASKPIHALVNGQLNWVANLVDQSGMALSGVTINLSDHASAAMNLTLPYGHSRDVNHYEYGALPIGFNVNLNWVY